MELRARYRRTWPARVRHVLCDKAEAIQLDDAVTS